MQNDEIVTPEVTTDDTQVETTEGETEVVEETTTEETTEATPEETPEEKLAKAENEAAKYRRLYEKSQKPKGTTKVVTKAPQSTSSSVEETVLLAQGMDESLLKELKAVAQVRKLSLIKAQNDPIFIAVKEKFEKDQKQKGASLPASRGSGGVKAVKSVSSPGLSRDEHKKLAMDIMNNS